VRQLLTSCTHGYLIAGWVSQGQEEEDEVPMAAGIHLSCVKPMGPLQGSPFFALRRPATSSVAMATVPSGGGDSTSGSGASTSAADELARLAEQERADEARRAAAAERERLAEAERAAAAEQERLAERNSNSVWLSV
jgi:hypothetical protein